MNTANMISIIIPVYNTIEYLDECIKSVLSQTYKNLEVILVDDGSTDGSLDKCRSYEKRDSRIRVITQKNAGPGAAVKNGIIHASGKYLMFVDSDDWVDVDYCESLINIAMEHNCEIVVGGMTINFDNGTERKQNGFSLKPGRYRKKDIEDTVFPRILSTGCAGHYIILPSRVSKIYEREIVLRNIDIISTDFKRGEDFLLLFSSLFLCESLYLEPDYYSYHYRMRDASITHSYDQELFRDLLRGVKAQEIIINHYGKNAEFKGSIEAEKLDITYITVQNIVLNKSVIGKKKAKELLCNTILNSDLKGTVNLGMASGFERIVKTLILRRSCGSVWMLMNCRSAISQMKNKLMH